MINEEKKTPVHRIRRGGIEASIWKNEGKNGPFHNVTFKRTYRAADGSYHDSHSYALQDVAELAHIATGVYLWMATLRPSEEETRPN